MYLSQLTTAGFNIKEPEGMTTQDKGSDTPVERLRMFLGLSSLHSFPLQLPVACPLRSEHNTGTTGKPRAEVEKAGGSNDDLSRPLKDRTGELGLPTMLRSSGRGLRGDKGKEVPKRAAAALGRMIWA